MEAIPYYENCFVCGRRPGDLGVEFYADGAGARAEFVPDARWQGYPGIVHGGILSALLDEVMYKAVFAAGKVTVTAELVVRFRAPAPVGARLLLKGEVVEDRGKIVRARGEIRLAGGEVVATGEAKYWVLPPERAGELASFLVDV